jgi:hypothetical protein
MKSLVILGLLVVIVILILIGPATGGNQGYASGDPPAPTTSTTPPAVPHHEPLPETLSGRFSDDYETYKRKEQEVLAMREKQAMNVRGIDYTNADIYDEVTRDIRGYSS